jgi:hypothetical protein
LPPNSIARHRSPPTGTSLDPSSHGFGPGDLDRPIFIDGVLGLQTATVNEMLAILKRTYCGTFGIEFMHITDPGEKSWIQERIEGPDKEIAFTTEGKRSILKKLLEGESFEKFVHKRHPGTKRFGLDGGEAMLPALEQIIKRGGALGVQEIILGMAHRGRLNVLAAVMGNRTTRSSMIPGWLGDSGRRAWFGRRDITWAPQAIAPSTATTSTSRSPQTRRTSKSSTPSCSARRAPSKPSAPRGRKKAKRCTICARA